MEIGLEEPEGLAKGSAAFPPGARVLCTNEQGGCHGFLAQVQQKLLQCHRLIVDAYYEMAELWQEELDVFVGESAELVAEDIVDPNVVGIPAGRRGLVSVRDYYIGQRRHELTRGRIQRGRG